VLGPRSSGSGGQSGFVGRISTRRRGESTGAPGGGRIIIFLPARDLVGGARTNPRREHRLLESTVHASIPIRDRSGLRDPHSTMQTLFEDLGIATGRPSLHTQHFVDEELPASRGSLVA
jgi:hypothetical protein